MVGLLGIVIPTGDHPKGETRAVSFRPKSGRRDSNPDYVLLHPVRNLQSGCWELNPVCLLLHPVKLSLSENRDSNPDYVLPKHACCRYTILRYLTGQEAGVLPLYYTPVNFGTG